MVHGMLRNPLWSADMLTASARGSNPPFSLLCLKMKWGKASFHCLKSRVSTVVCFSQEASLESPS